jgi:hypothetical protein
VQTVIRSFITTNFPEDIPKYHLPPYRNFLAKDVFRRKIFLAMVSIAGDALILTSTVLSSVLVILNSEIIFEINFPFES